MSLRAVHMAFIVTAILLSFGFGAWTLGADGAAAVPHHRIWASASALLGAGLIVYFMWFVKKTGQAHS